MHAEHLIIFLKAPRAGTVKTRLASEIGTEAALTAYKTIVDRLFQNLSRLSQVELRFTPDNAKPETLVWLRDGWVCSPQGTGGLSERLIEAFNHAFKRGARSVVIIGSDCPYLTAT